VLAFFTIHYSLFTTRFLMRLPASRALEAIQSGKLAPAYIFLGQEIYWRDRLLAALRRAIGADDASQSLMAVSEYDLRGDSLARVLEAARERSLLAPRRLLLVRNAQTLAGQRGGKGGSRRRAKSSDSPSQPPQPDDLSVYFRNPCPDAVLVFEMMDVDLDSDDWRERERVQSRLEALGASCDLVLLAAPSFGDAMELVRQEAAARGCAISPDAAELLVTSFDRDMGRIRMEVEKLSVAQHEASRKTPKITAEDVTRLSSSLSGGSSLPLVDALGSGDSKKALEAVAEVERSGRYAPLVLLEVTRYLRQLVLLREKRVHDPRQASSALWSAHLPAPQGILPSLIEQSRRIRGRNLLSALEAAYDAEIALRSSPPSDRIILERFILQFMNLSRPSSHHRSS
jgi:DNA polymerase-3 subunit delta